MIIFIAFWLLSASLHADDSLPIIEMKADRTMIYPQRMELTGEESLMDILQMVPELMIAGYEDVINGYNLRIDNCPMNGDVRLILSQMKAKDIAKIQVCDNTGVAKGTVGLGNVLDINMLMPDSVKGFVEGQGGFGKDIEGNVLHNTHDDEIIVLNRYIENGELATLIVNSLFVILPYKSATQSGVTKSAIALDKPMICTNVGNLPNEVIDGRYGKIVSPNDTDSLCPGINYLLENPNVVEEFAKNIHSDVETGNNSWKSITLDIVTNVYSKILND